MSLGVKTMTIEDFLSQLNHAEKGWGLWLDRDNGKNYHVGQYHFENDRMPKSFIHVGNLNYIAHLRQKYLWSKMSESKNELLLGKEWAETFLAQWRNQNLKSLV